MIGDSLGYVVGISSMLLLYGVAFNDFVQKRENAKQIEGRRALYVVAGVIGTGIGMFFLDLYLDWNAAFIAALAFALTGTPMIYGDLKRFFDEMEQLKAEIKKGE